MGRTSTGSLRNFYYQKSDLTAVVLILIRYGEIALKSHRTRVRFGKDLVQNIENAFAGSGLECIINEERGRIFLETADPTKAGTILKDTFGIVSFSEVTKVKTDRGSISRTAVELLKDRVSQGKTFAVRCRRKGSHEFTSQEMAAWVGEDILDAFQDLGLKVDLTDPSSVVELEIRDGNTYVFLDRVEGPGGFPLGSQGSLTGLVELEDLDDPKNMLVAFYLMMKRGCRLVLNCPFEEGKHQQRLEEVLGLLQRFDPKIKVLYKPGLLTDDEEVVTTQGDGVSAIVSGRDLGRGLLNSEVPIFYPVIGLENGMLDEFHNRMLY